MGADLATQSLLHDLAAWSDDQRNYHADRALADRVLLAAGWRCLPDPGHRVGVKWECGTNPVYTSWEPHHPHPINSIDDAMAQVPGRWRIWQMTRMSGFATGWHVQASDPDCKVATGTHAALPVAISIIAVKAWGVVNERNRASGSDAA